MNPQPSWDELQDYYHDDYPAYDPRHGAEATDEQEIEEALRKGRFRHIPLPVGKRLLDVGCGAGWFLHIAKNLGAVEQGIEPSGHAAKVAQERGLRVYHGTLEAYVANEAGQLEFDIITANHVLEHVPEPVETPQFMKEMLAPGGFIWIAVPNAGYPICRALKGRWHSSDLPYHLMQFTPKSIAEAGERAGLRTRHQITESIPRCVSASLRQYLRYQWKLPSRLTQKLRIVDTAATWYAQRVDSRAVGEAILTEFVAK